MQIKSHSTKLLACLPPDWNPKMGASSLLDELDIMFTVIGFGLVVITANFVVLPHRDIKLLPVVVAIWALGFIAGKIAYKQEMLIHLIEIATLSAILLVLARPAGVDLQGMYMHDHSSCTSYILLPPFLNI
jgi:hypothetical protein